MDRRGLLASAAAAGVVVAAVAVSVGLTVTDDSPDPATPAATSDTGTDQQPSSSPDASAAERPPPQRWLLPNARSLRARNVHITGDGDNRRLRFAAWLANDGPGPLLLEPRPARNCPQEQRGAAQMLHRDSNRDGRYQRGGDPRDRSEPVGCMVDHPTHGHWHFDAMARYALTRVDGSPVVQRNKVSFCLRDNRRVPDSGPVSAKEHFGECERDTVQGISPGWVDIYDVDTPGQSLRLPAGLPDGNYCLVLEADPRRLLLETDENDNATPLVIRIEGTQVRMPGTGVCADVAQ